MSAKNDGGSFVSRAQSALLGYIYGLAITNLAARTLTIGTGTARDSGNAANINLNLPTTLDLAATGANGRNVDTALQANRFYRLAVISGTGGAASFAVNENDLATYTMPVGYSFIRFIGWAKTDAASNIYPCNWFGAGCSRKLFYQVDQVTLSVLIAGNQVVFTAVSCAAWLPTGETRPLCVIDYTNWGVSWFAIRPGGSTLATPPFYCDAGAQYTSFMPLVTSATRNLEYRTFGPGERLTISVIGFEYEV